MIYKNEQQILLVIRYALPLLILILSIIITAFLFYENKSDYEELKNRVEEAYIKNTKQVIKEQVENVYDYVISEQSSTEEKLKNSLISRVHEAHEMILNINKHNKNINGNDINKLIPLIKASIVDTRFNNGRGYFFVYDKKATNIIHPLIPKLEGKNLINHQDTKGTYVLRESLELLKDKDESYQEWYWRKAKNDMNEYKKIGFVKNIYELDWFIGTGEYVEDFSKDIQRKVLEQIEKLKFGKNSYFIVVDKNNNYISHINKNLIGKNALKKLREMNDTKSIEKIEKVLKAGEGFIHLDFFKPNSKEISSKIIYSKNVPEWNWAISTGFYTDDVSQLIIEEEKRLKDKHKENIQNLLVISILSTILLLLISFYISIIIEKKFKQYQLDIQHHIDENQRQYKLLAQKSKLAAMGEMMGNIAHQWRQPLSLISSASSGIRLHKEMNTLTDETLLNLSDTITNSAQHLSDTIEDFREFYKPNKEKTIFTMNSTFDKTFSFLSSQFRSHNIEVIKNIDDIKMEGYERELLQVLLNILNNARDALKDRDDKKLIFIDVYKEKENVIINIKDNAGGISEKIIDRIFEPYFTTKHQSQGTGIGLYMSQEIVTKHMSGKINANNSIYDYKNKKYKGAIFRVELPIREE